MEVEQGHPQKESPVEVGLFHIHDSCRVSGETSFPPSVTWRSGLVFEEHGEALVQVRPSPWILHKTAHHCCSCFIWSFTSPYTYNILNPRHQFSLYAHQRQKIMTVFTMSNTFYYFCQFLPAIRRLIDTILRSLHLHLKVTFMRSWGHPDFSRRKGRFIPSGPASRSVAKGRPQRPGGASWRSEGGFSHTGDHSVGCAAIYGQTLPVGWHSKQNVNMISGCPDMFKTVFGSTTNCPKHVARDRMWPATSSGQTSIGPVRSGPVGASGPVGRWRESKAETVGFGDAKQCPNPSLVRTKPCSLGETTLGESVLWSIDKLTHINKSYMYRRTHPTCNGCLIDVSLMYVKRRGCTSEASLQSPFSPPLCWAKTPQSALFCTAECRLTAHTDRWTHHTHPSKLL